MRERDRGRGTCQRDFEESFLEAIDEGLSSLGDSGKQAIYFYLEEKFGLNKQEICNRPNDFADALERIFGLGANFLELLILKQLRERTGSLAPAVSGRMDFAECVAVAAGSTRRQSTSAAVMKKRPKTATMTTN